MPMLPVHQGWAASQAITSARSRCSASGYSSVATPPLEPVPRTSTRATAKPNSSAKRAYSGRQPAVMSSLRYGSASRMQGAGCTSGRNSVTDSRTPSLISISACIQPLLATQPVAHDAALSHLRRRSTGASSPPVRAIRRGETAGTSLTRCVRRSTTHP